MLVTECIKVHVVSERQECVDDVRQTCKSEVQVRKSAVVSRGVLCEYSRSE